jgi:exonuclease III
MFDVPPRDENLVDFDPDTNYFNELYSSLNSHVQSKYYDPVELNNISLTVKSGITIFNLNIRSFFKNVDNFVAFLAALNHVPDIVVLTETWLNDSNKIHATLDGYIPFHTVREQGRRRGVSVFCREGLSVRLIDNLCVSDENIESCVVGVTIGRTTELSVFGIYRPHSGTIENFTETLNELFYKYNRIATDRVVLLGDFNANLLDVDSATINALSNFLRTFHFVPAITKATRFSPDTRIVPTLLDHIWINSLDHYLSGIVSIDLTDHCPVFITVSINCEDNVYKKVKVTFRDQSKQNVDNFRSVLGETVWDFDSCTNINDKIDYLGGVLDDCYNRSFPLRIKYITEKRLNKPWLTRGILNSIRVKSKYFKFYRLGLITKEINNEYKNSLNNVIRNAKRKYFCELFEANKNNLKKSWQGINHLMGRGRNNRTPVRSLNVDDTLLSTEQDIANAFNHYFSTVADELEIKIPASDNVSPCSQINQQINSFYLYPVSCEDCLNIISDLKNTSYGVNSISVKLLKSVKEVLIAPIMNIVNDSFNSGIFPDNCKNSCITPVFKGGDPLDVSNYRPISVLPLLSKIIEKCMYKRLSKFLFKYSIITPYQFGFQRNKSTCDAISTLSEYIYEGLNEKKHNISVFIDLKKAYDTVQHSILLDKMFCYGIRGIPLQWFRSYLSNRQHCVRIGDYKSQYTAIRTGIPQGSVLGGILFLLYINDLTKVSDTLSSILFADDTTLSLSNRSYATLINDLNVELDKIKIWLIRNRLSLNIEKTFAVNFTKRPIDINDDIQVVLGGSVVNFSPVVKYLGVNIDRNMSFVDHVNYICSKISKTVGIMYRLAPCVPERILIDIYYSLVYPYLIYCNLVWGSAAGNHINKLLLQKKMVRIITGSGYLDHCDPLFKRTKILKIGDINTFLCSIFAYKNSVNFETSNHAYNTRFKDNAVPKFQRLSICQRSLSFVAPRLYNDLPMKVKQCKSLVSFKQSMKDYLLNCYTE